VSANLYPSADLNSSLAASAHWHDLPAEAHSVQFYGEDEALIEGLSRFIGAALGAGDAAVVIATPAHRSALNKQLRALGLDVQLATSEGRFVALDAAATLSKFVVNGRLQADRFNGIIGKVLTGVRASCRGENPRIAAFGEMVALLWADGKAEQAVQLEQFWNDLSHTHSFHLRCAYPIGAFDRSADVAPFHQICSEHSHVIPSEGYTALPSEADRLRTISEWQQKALALENEIAQRKKTEEALRDSYQQLRISEERLRLTQRAAHIGTWELDLETDEMALSDEACEMLALPREGCMTKQDLLNKLSYQSDRENFLKSLFQTIHRNRDFETEFRVGTDEEVLLLSARGKMFYNQGRPLVVGVLIDISDASKALETHRRTAQRRPRPRKSGAAAS
jgi:PAS domain-containing protein